MIKSTKRGLLAASLVHPAVEQMTLLTTADRGRTVP